MITNTETKLEKNIYKQLYKALSLIEFPQWYLSLKLNDSSIEYWCDVIIKFIKNNSNKKESGYYNNNIMYSVGTETILSLFTNINNPIVLYTDCDNCGTDLASDDACLAEIYIICWDYNDKLKVFFKINNYFCPYHTYNTYTLHLSTPKEYVELLYKDNDLSDNVSCDIAKLILIDK